MRWRCATRSATRTWASCSTRFTPTSRRSTWRTPAATFHANIEEKHVADACRVAGRHLKHVHTCENDRGIPGTGHVDWPGVFQALRDVHYDGWPGVFQALRDVHYDGWLTIESFGFALGELSAAASIWRDIAPSPESIAFEGVKFLKRSMAAG